MILTIILDFLIAFKRDRNRIHAQSSRERKRMLETILEQRVQSLLIHVLHFNLRLIFELCINCLFRGMNCED